MPPHLTQDEVWLPLPFRPLPSLSRWTTEPPEEDPGLVSTKWAW